VDWVYEKVIEKNPDIGEQSRGGQHDKISIGGEKSKNVFKED